MTCDVRRGRRMAGSTRCRASCGTTRFPGSRVGREGGLTRFGHSDFTTDPRPSRIDRLPWSPITGMRRFEVRKYAFRTVRRRQRRRVMFGDGACRSRVGRLLRHNLG